MKKVVKRNFRQIFQNLGNIMSKFRDRYSYSVYLIDKHKLPFRYVKQVENRTNLVNYRAIKNCLEQVLHEHRHRRPLFLLRRVSESEIISYARTYVLVIMFVHSGLKNYGILISFFTGTRWYSVSLCWTPFLLSWSIYSNKIRTVCISNGRWEPQPMSHMSDRRFVKYTTNKGNNIAT